MGLSHSIVFFDIERNGVVSGKHGAVWTGGWAACGGGSLHHSAYRQSDHTGWGGGGPFQASQSHCLTFIPYFIWGGRRDSNPSHCHVTNELLPPSLLNIVKFICITLSVPVLILISFFVLFVPVPVRLCTGNRILKKCLVPVKLN
jgi:hypothetical protein